MRYANVSSVLGVIRLLQMTTGDGSIKVIRQLQDYPAERSEDVTQRLNQVAQLLNACHESCGPLEDVPVERLQRDANASVEVRLIFYTS